MQWICRQNQFFSGGCRTASTPMIERQGGRGEHATWQKWWECADRDAARVIWLRSANWRHNGETWQERVKRVWCFSASGERGAEAREQRGKGRRYFFCVTESEWGKGGREIMRAREQTVASQRASALTDSCGRCKVHVSIWEEEGEEDRKLCYVCKSCSGSVYTSSLCLCVRQQQQFHW